MLFDVESLVFLNKMLCELRETTGWGTWNELFTALIRLKIICMGTVFDESRNGITILPDTIF